MESSIQFEGYGPQPLKAVRFDAEAREFVISAGASGELSCRLTYPFEAFGPGAEEAYVEVLCHPSHSESDIRRVKLSYGEGKTVGWLCTVGALVSAEHAHVDSRHFRRAAYAAVQSLLTSDRYFTTASIANGSGASLSDFFDEGLSVLVLHRPSLGDLLEDVCNSILPSLHRCGFVPVTASAPSQLLGRPSIERFSDMGENFLLKPTSKEVGFSQFTSQVFRQLLPTANTSLLRFFLYYQLIEAMMAIVFAHRQSETIERMQHVKDDPVKVHPLIEKLREDSAEKKRMRLLFNEYTGCSHGAAELMLLCNEFLMRCDSARMELPADALYQVRNIIFHGMRSIPERAYSAFDALVDELSCVVPELLIAFKLHAQPDS